MLTKSPMRNSDLRHADTSGIDRNELRDLQRKAQIKLLGDRWLLSKANAPEKGNYNPITGKKLA